MTYLAKQLNYDYIYINILKRIKNFWISVFLITLKTKNRQYAIWQYAYQTNLVFTKSLDKNIIILIVQIQKQRYIKIY